MRTLLSFTLAALLATPAAATPAAAQERTVSPFHTVLSTEVDAPAIDAPERDAPELDAPERDTRGAVMMSPWADADGGNRLRTSSSEKIGGALLASVGSLGLMYAGALYGYSAGGDYENYGGLVLGAAAGSVIGSTVGASVVVGRPGHAFLGSVGGGILGYVVAMGLSRTQDGALSLASYVLVQGTVATLVAAR